MGLPLLTRMLVTALGGRGAWAPKPAAVTKAKGGAKGAAPVEEPSFLSHFKLPTSVWLPPLGLICISRGDDDVSFVFTLAGVYLLLVAVQMMIDKITGKRGGVASPDKPKKKS